MCAAAAATVIDTAGGLSQDAVITYDSSAAEAIYAIGRLAAQIPLYNPAAAKLDDYGFTSATLDPEITPLVPTVYQVVNGVASEVETGVCATDSYNTADPSYTIVSWESLLTLPVLNGGWYSGAGGYCTLSGDPPVYSSGTVPAGGAITSPPQAVKTLLPGTTSPSIPGSGPGGGGGDAEPGDCNVFIGVVTNAPGGGFGVGAVQSATFSSDGSYWTDEDKSISVVFPYIN